MTTAVAQPPPARSAMRRWVPRLLVAFITLLLVVIVITQIILNSSLPKKIVLAQVENLLGLRISAASLSTGWLGHTTLKDVQVSLPLSNEAFLTLPELRVVHTNLPMLLITRSLVVHSIELERPTVTVTQDKYGRWNLQDVAEIMLKLGGQGQAQQTPNKSSPLVLPSVALRDGTIDITDNQKRHAVLTPLEVTGQSINSLVWTYKANLDSPDGVRASFSGRVVPSDQFKHEVDFGLSGLAPLVKPWYAGFDPNATVDGKWNGAAANGGVSGRLLLAKLRYAPITAEDGNFIVSAAGTAVTIQPVDLLLAAGKGALRHLRVTGGAIHATAAEASIDQLELTAAGGDARIEGHATLADRTGRLNVTWNALHPLAAVDSTGSLTASMSPRWPDRYAIGMRVIATGSAAGSPYTADVGVNAAGKNWNAAEATIHVTTLQYAWKSPVHLDGLTAHLVSDPGKITLADVALPRGGEIAGGGELHYDANHPSAAKYDWFFNLTGHSLPIPPNPASTLLPRTVAIAVNATGNQLRIKLERAQATLGAVTANATGFYHIKDPRPVDLNVKIAEANALSAAIPVIAPEIAPTSAPTAAATAAPTTMPLTAAGAAPSFITGHLRGDAHLTGTLYPLNIILAGQLHGRGLFVGDHPVQNIDVRCNGVADKNHAVLDTEELKLLGGEWKLHAQMPGRDEVPEAMLRFHDLSLAAVADLVHQSGVAGTAAGSIDAEMTEPSLDHLAASGEFSAEGVRARQILRIDSVSGKLTLHKEQLDISPVHLTDANGHADVTLAANLAHPALITATLNAGDWPIDLGAVHAVAGAETKHLLIDIRSQTVNGALAFNSNVVFQKNPVATVDGSLALAGQTAALDRFHADVLGGAADGTASVTLHAPLASRASFAWHGINLNALSPYQARLKEAGGSLDGWAVLSPDTDPRARSPLLLTIDSAGRNTHIGPVKLSGFHLPIWIDLSDRQFSRAVLDGGHIGVADGDVGLYARVSLHEVNNNSIATTLVSSQLDATLDNLDTDQLLNEVEMSSTTEDKKATTKNNIAAYPGRLDGKITVVGNPRQIYSLFGGASLSIHDSDLGNFGPFAALYNTMHLGGGPATPIGTGGVDARFDNDNFIISNLHYFNRGTYAYGLLSIDGVSQYPQSTLSGTLAGTFRPLSNIKLPFFADADQIFSVLQSNLTSIVVGGTIQKPTYTPQSAAEFTGAFRNFLLGDVNSK